MKFKYIIAASALVLPFAATPAFAQDSEEHWEGAHIGGSFGLSSQSNDRGETVLFDTDRDGAFDNNVLTSGGANAFSTGFCNGRSTGATSAAGCDGDKDDFEYYVRAGYDVQNGNIVYGIIFDGGKTEARDSVTAFSITPAAYTFTHEIDYSIGARARVGYAARGALFYATGGAAYAKIDNSFSTTNTANSFADNGSTKSWGYSAGGGAEVKIARNFSIGLEYLYTNYVDDDFRVNVGPGTALPTNPFLLNGGGTDFRRSDRDFDMHNIRMTAAIRF